MATGSRKKAGLLVKEEGRWATGNRGGYRENTGKD